MTYTGGQRRDYYYGRSSIRVYRKQRQPRPSRSACGTFRGLNERTRAVTSKTGIERSTIDELVDRGYDAVRIDAYPHLVEKDLNRTWTIAPNPSR